MYVNYSGYEADEFWIVETFELESDSKSTGILLYYANQWLFHLNRQYEFCCFEYLLTKQNKTEPILYCQFISLFT